MFHFADAPPHGSTYYQTANDSHPAGCPAGLKARNLLQRLHNDLHVQYFFAKLNSSCDVMLREFEKELKALHKVFLLKYLVKFSNYRNRK